MIDSNTNDNEPTGVPASAAAAQGRAAILLVESLVHGLIAREVITANDALEIVESATEIERELAQVADEAANPVTSSLVILTAIGQSLLSDVQSASRLEP